MSTGQRFRVETDSLGEVRVPVDAYWGVHTVRARENFPISGTPIARHAHLVRALATVKQAAARANRGLGLLDGRPGGGDRARLRAGAARRAARPVLRRRRAGRRGHEHQHERQRGHRQRGAGAARPRAGPLRRDPPDRRREPQPVHERRLSDGDPTGGRRRARRTGARAGPARGLVRRARRGLRGRAQGRAHAAAGRRAHDARRRVRGLRRRRSRGRRDGSGRPIPLLLEMQPRRHGDRNRGDRTARLSRGGRSSTCGRSAGCRSPRPRTSSRRRGTRAGSSRPLRCSAARR